MPIYEAECSVCDKQYEWLSVHVTDITNSCPFCGGEGKRLYSRYAARVFSPFVTRNIRPDGVPVLVESQSQLSSLCNEYKLNHLDDPKWQPKSQKFPDMNDIHEALGTKPMSEAERGVDGGACKESEILA